jgi:hypothetical protein
MAIDRARGRDRNDAARDRGHRGYIEFIVPVAKRHHDAVFSVRLEERLLDRIVVR